jgi:hypothetical protein
VRCVSGVRRAAEGAEELLELDGAISFVRVEIRQSRCDEVLREAASIRVEGSSEPGSRKSLSGIYQALEAAAWDACVLRNEELLDQLRCLARPF